MSEDTNRKKDDIDPQADCDQAVFEVSYHNPLFREALIELLRKHELTAELAVYRLRLFCDEILAHFNTKDITEYTKPAELWAIEYRKKEKLAEKTRGQNIGAGLD